MHDEPMEILSLLLARDFVGARELRAQLERASMPSREEIYPDIAFDVPADAPRAQVVATVPVEASARDMDGTRIHFILHVRGGMLAYFDVFREDFGNVVRWPTASELEVLTYPIAG